MTLPVVVIKVGSNALLDDVAQLDVAYLDLLAQQIVALRERYRVVLVSSGAVACGRAVVDGAMSGDSLSERQALAATGQARLVHAWQLAFARYGGDVAQVLLTNDDFHERQRYLNLSNCLRSLFEHGIVPIVNENDTVAVEELTLGDNDRLSAMLATQLGAAHLCLLTDCDGLYDADPRQNPHAQRIAELRGVDKQTLALAGGAGSIGRGGMLSKLQAARLASSAGVPCTIAYARAAAVLERILNHEDIGTLVHARVGRRSRGRQSWLALARKTKGHIVIDDGAVLALRQGGNSLLLVGCLAGKGQWKRGDTLSIVDQAGHEIARGLVNLSSEELSGLWRHSMRDAET